VVAGDVDADTANVFGMPLAGAQWLDLNGQGPGTIQQSFSTTPGAAYVLSCFYANNTATGFDATAPGSVAGFGPIPLLAADISHHGSTTADMNYQTFVSTFVADGGTATLRFEATSYGTSGIALDGVSGDEVAVTAVPEPSSLPHAAAGILVLLTLGRRREKR
jgi:hypothetical protein